MDQRKKKSPNQLCMTTREEWRTWLAENHASEKEVWLIHYKKHTGKPGITYEDAVEEALCFGWIDGLLRRLDDERYILRYSPRKKKSIWSELNKERAERMIDQGQMTEAGLAKISEAKKNGEWYREIASEIPPDLKEALAAKKKALENFEGFSTSLQKRFIWWVDSAKKEETRQKRIQETVDMAEQKKKP